jgi:mercuric ion transport protein
MRRTALWAGAGGVTAAFLGSLCCAGPLLFVTLGVGAGLASTFEPLRPVFAVVMFGLFSLAFYSVYGRRAGRTGVGQSDSSTVGQSAGDTCTADTACAVSRYRRRERVILWLAALLALVLWMFPTWSRSLV